jgi:hypothetical protein
MLQPRVEYSDLGLILLLRLGFHLADHVERPERGSFAAD